MPFLLLGAALLNAYAVVLIVARALVYRTRLYRPMLWNILLSIAPILILLLGVVAWAALTFISRPLAFAVLALFFLAWLLLLPNASYLITELNQSHRQDDDPVPMWYDIILVITLALSGVANTVVNVFVAHLGFGLAVYGDRAASFTRPLSLAAVGVVLLMVGFGIYLGRYLRLNSWDVTHPRSLLQKVVAHFRVPANAAAAFGLTVTYAVFLGIVYTMIAGSIVDGLRSLELLRAS